MRIVFWGTGNTAKEYIDQIKQLSDQFEIVAFTDGNQKKADSQFTWEGYRLIDPQMIPSLNIDCLCILSIWEWEIRKRIYNESLFELSKIISFHEIYMMDFWGMDIDGCYENKLKIIHPLQTQSEKMWMAYEYLKRNYSYVLCDNKYWEQSTDKKVYFEENVKPVWILWMQGIDQAPEIVKVCVHSLKRILGKTECVCLLDKDNIFEYIDLPDYIIQKWESGIIDNTKFSNLVRLRLLNVYGGVWIDATVYFTGDRLPAYIKNSNLFMFNIWENWRVRQEPAISASWLIASPAGNNLLMILEALHLEYWKKENSVINYSIIHIFWTMVAECFPKEWEQVEVVLRDAAQLLVKELTCTFDEERFEYLKKISDIHKLSYKIPYMSGGENSFWNKICEIESESDNDV